MLLKPITALAAAALLATLAAAPAEARASAQPTGDEVRVLEPGL